MKPLAAAAFAALAALSVAVAPGAHAAVQTMEVTYQQGETDLQGYLAWDDSAKGRRPGVVIVHEWWGHNEHARNQARRLAKDGYVAFALDMFGKGKLAQHPEDAQAFVAEATKDLEVLTARFQAAVDRLKADEHVDPERIGAIGYCFGGAVVLGMARRGADLDAVVSFHGSIATPTPAEKGAVKARVLVLNGAEDPMVSAEAIEAFKKEMTDAGASFEFVNLPGAKHSFTNPEADKRGMPALAYSAKADKQSWKEMLALFREIWGK